MVLFKHKLPNGNVFIWLGGGGIWKESDGIDNVLILYGGDVLFLKTDKILSLNKKGVKEDIETLSYENFTKKYKLPMDIELWKELKQGISIGKYPLINENYEGWVREIREMVSAYIANILSLHDSEEKIQQLNEIIRECQMKIIEIEKAGK